MIKQFAAFVGLTALALSAPAQAQAPNDAQIASSESNIDAALLHTRSHPLRNTAPSCLISAPPGSAGTARRHRSRTRNNRRASGEAPFHSRCTRK